MNAEPQNIEQANFEGFGRLRPSAGPEVSFSNGASASGGGTEVHREWANAAGRLTWCPRPYSVSEVMVISTQGSGAGRLGGYPE